MFCARNYSSNNTAKFTSTTKSLLIEYKDYLVLLMVVCTANTSFCVHGDHLHEEFTRMEVKGH